MSKVSYKAAKSVVSAIEKHWADELDRYLTRPVLRDHNHECQSEGSWSIDWEEGPTDWAFEFIDVAHETRMTFVYVEPINPFVLGVHPA